jgi:hypothetical protein
VRTSEIYWGAVPFLGIQLFMVALIVAFPELVSWGLDAPAASGTPTEVTIPDQGGGSSLLDSQDFNFDGPPVGPSDGGGQ